MKGEGEGEGEGEHRGLHACGLESKVTRSSEITVDETIMAVPVPAAAKQKPTLATTSVAP